MRSCGSPATTRPASFTWLTCLTNVPTHRRYQPIWQLYAAAPTRRNLKILSHASPRWLVGRLHSLRCAISWSLMLMVASPKRMYLVLSRSLGMKFEASSTILPRSLKNSLVHLIKVLSAFLAMDGSVKPH